MRRMRAPVAVHSIRPERNEAAVDGLGVNGGEDETSRSGRSGRSRRSWMGPREKEEDDIRIEDVDENEQQQQQQEDEDDEDVLDLPATHAPRRVERASRRSAASTPRPSVQSEAEAGSELESESVEDIDGNMVIYVSST